MVAAAAMNLLAASGALGALGALIEQRARPAVARKIAQMAVEASRPLAPVASKAVFEATLQFVAVAVASRVVAVASDWPAVEVERSRSYRKSEHHRVEPLRNWRIVAYW